MPVPHHSIFTGWMLFLTPNQQCQSTEGKKKTTIVLVLVLVVVLFLVTVVAAVAVLVIADVAEVAVVYLHCRLLLLWLSSVADVVIFL